MAASRTWISFSTPSSPNTWRTAPIICTVISACVSGKRPWPASVRYQIWVGRPRPALWLSESTSPSACNRVICWRTASAVPSMAFAMPAMDCGPRVFKVMSTRAAG
ncbi:hypothetical protein G6F50_017381 [Rhizopus delemar]|uniref:Uncharacterized protein n=1 Tax=Rhizopus delemar TaxID=936053 RepID=A0A9P7C093_9FUNG|nr:hypothetical protein G6F50_017381 [Rhizopus delemar]